jgi:hypothetical protein
MIINIVKNAFSILIKVNLRIMKQPSIRVNDIERDEWNFKFLHVFFVDFFEFNSETLAHNAAF